MYSIRDQDRGWTTDEQFITFPTGDKRRLAFPKCPYWLCSPPNLVLNLLKPGGNLTYHQV
jgi:hypothetical protein